MIVAWTGHRNLDYLYNALFTAHLDGLHKHHPDLECITGGALGLDQAVAWRCLMRRIPYRIYLPFPIAILSARWPKGWDEDLTMLCDHAKEVRVLSQEYASAYYQKRNEAMVDDADLLVAVWDGREKGGTWNTIQYARRVGKPVEYVRI